MDNIFNLNDEEPIARDFDNISQLRPAFAWLNELNNEQKEAVTATEGPLLVLSGAGTGKTKVLTTRLAYILYNMKANPWNCLVVTFTNRAAAEMKERTRQMIGDMVSSVWLGTFHSICVKILRVYPELVGLKNNFTILDEDDQKRVIKQILTDEKIDDKKYPPQAVIDHISRWKDKGLTYDKLAPSVHDNTLIHIYDIYQKRMLEMNCIDFGDILLYTLDILMKNEDILSLYQDKFKYVMVDEYQDTNVVQYLLLRLLVQKSRNLCCVGDDDQSIYSWRGAEIENILRFNKDFTDARIIRLEQNYRSSSNILSAADSLISHNKSRLGKTLRVADKSPAKYADNEKIKLISTYSGEDEAKYVVSEIEKLKHEGFAYSDMAILVRTAFQTREFEEKLIAEAVPYQVIGGPKFYERAEIRDALAYFRLVLQPSDDLAFERIINKPARGIGKKSIDKIRDYGRNVRLPMYHAAQQMIENGELSGKTKTSLELILAKFEDWRKLLPAVPLSNFASEVLAESGYFEMLKADKSPESQGRIENLRELINVMSDTEQYPDLNEFLEHVSLVTENDSHLDKNKVMLITLHSAKGLEFDVVFLPGWEEGLFPHKRSIDEGGNNSLEEERRLAYVAITRAKKKLYILTAMSRRIYGEWQNTLPSRFINEIPTNTLNICNNSLAFSNNNSYKSNSNWSSVSYRKPQNYSNYSCEHDEEYYPNSARSYYSNKTNGYYQNSARGYNSKVSDNYHSASQIKKRSPYIGVRVYHEDFGFGKIVDVDDQTCEVEFEDGSRKKILGTYLRRA